jgi:hypothetical protein
VSYLGQCVGAVLGIMANSPELRTGDGSWTRVHLSFRLQTTTALADDFPSGPLSSDDLFRRSKTTFNSGAPVLSMWRCLSKQMRHQRVRRAQRVITNGAGVILYGLFLPQSSLSSLDLTIHFIYIYIHRRGCSLLELDLQLSSLSPRPLVQSSFPLGSLPHQGSSFVPHVCFPLHFMQSTESPHGLLNELVNDTHHQIETARYLAST